MPSWMGVNRWQVNWKYVVPYVRTYVPIFQKGVKHRNPGTQPYVGLRASQRRVTLEFDYYGDSKFEKVIGLNHQIIGRFFKLKIRRLNKLASVSSNKASLHTFGLDEKPSMPRSIRKAVTPWLGLAAFGSVCKTTACRQKNRWREINPHFKLFPQYANIPNWWAGEMGTYLP